MQERVRTVLAARAAPSPGLAEPVRGSREPRRAASGSSAPEGVHAPEAHGSQVAAPGGAAPEDAGRGSAAEADPAVTSAPPAEPEPIWRWPERFDLPSGVPMFDPRWNSDLP